MIQDRIDWVLRNVNPMAVIMPVVVIIAVISWTVALIDFGTPKFVVGQSIQVLPSNQTGLVVGLDCWKPKCRYLVRTANPLREQWMREPGLEAVR
jgi:hypothetical protein